MMEPRIGRIAFNIAITLVILSLIPLPYLKERSAEFVINIIALIISLIFLFFIFWDVRRQVKKENIHKV